MKRATTLCVRTLRAIASELSDECSKRRAIAVKCGVATYSFPHNHGQADGLERAARRLRSRATRIERQRKASKP